MDTISFGNLTAQNAQMTPEMQKRLESQENFTAIDKEKLKQDTVEITNKAKENAKENFIFRGLRNFGINDPKKFLISCGLTLATIVGFATLGKKTLNKMTTTGINIDEKLAQNDFYKKISGFFTSAKTKIGDFFKKNKTIKEASGILNDKTRRAKPKIQLAKGMGQGFAPQFAYAVKDMFEASSIKGFIKQTECLTEVKAGTADFAVLDAQLAKSYCGKGDYADLVVVEELSSDVEYYAIGFKKESDLTAKVNAQLEKLGADGTIKALAEKYGVANTAITDFSDQK
jgi:hypothetical protein